MCLGADMPQAKVVESSDARAVAAADAAAMARRGAQGYTASIFGGANPSQPSLARQMLGLG